MFFAVVAKEIIGIKLCQKITNKYGKNRKNNKSKKNKDLEKIEAKKDPQNVRKYRKNRKYNKDFSCELKTPMTNIAKIINVTKF